MDLEYYPNDYTDIPENTTDLISATLESYLTTLRTNSPLSLPFSQTSAGNQEKKSRIYTGYGGKLYTFWKLSKLHPKYCSDFNTLKTLFNTQMPDLESNGATFFQGKIGIQCILAVSSRSENLLPEILSSIPNHFKKFELLYGTAGSLYSLGFLLKHWRDAPLACEIISKIQKLSNYLVRKSENSELLIHKYPSSSGAKYYLGAAHGTIGILYVMLQLRQYIIEHDSLIKNTLDFLIGQQLPSGNFPSKINSKKDESIHFCHGSTGAVGLLCLAYRVYGDRRYLEAAVRAADDIWNRGILRKGKGLCHGVAGNGYAFLWVYKATGEDVWIKRARKFALVLGYDEGYEKSIKSYDDPQRLVMGVADFPYSLMEGLSGTVCFLFDCMHPEESFFPGFDI